LKYLALIPARGGSKGVPWKNIRVLAGKPLIQYTIEAARGVFKDSNICVSTDSKKIQAIVQNIGLNVPFLRPAEYAQDRSGTHDVILHTLDYYKKKSIVPEAIVLLQPTSPLRNENHIKEALNKYESTPGLDMVVSVCESKANPYFNIFEENDNGYLVKSKEGSYERRQDCPLTWQYNGAIYVVNAESVRTKRLFELNKVQKYMMDEISSLDIDTELDFKTVKLILEE